MPGTKKILLVEDEAIIAMSEKSILEKYDLSVITVTSGEKAVSAVEQSGDIDLILMDIDLGRGIDGTEAAQQILQKKEIPIIFLSSHTEREIVEKTEGITSYGYIVKDSGETVLIASIKMAFRLLKARRNEREKEKKLRDREEKYRMLVENQTDIVVKTDPAGHFLFVSPSYCRTFGKSEEELIGDFFMPLIQEENGKKQQVTFQYLFKPPFRAYMEQQTRTTTGNRWLGWMVTAILSDQGEVEALIGVGRDITEQKHMEKALETRLLALTQPISENREVAFQDLFNINDIQKLQDEFAQAVNVASIITHPDGSPITKPSNFCKLCKDIIRKTDKGQKNCFKSDAYIGQPSTEGSKISHCMSGGLWDAGAAITVGGTHIASWLIGQVRDHTQTEEHMLKYAEEIGADKEEFLEAYHQVPKMSMEQFTNISKCLFTLANQLSSIAYQNVQQARFISERDESKKKMETLLKKNETFLKNRKQ